MYFSFIKTISSLTIAFLNPFIVLWFKTVISVPAYKNICLQLSFGKYVKYSSLDKYPT